MAGAHHILIVDDEPNVRLVFRTALDAPERRISTASDGESALMWLENAAFDLILLDLQMPGLGGMEVLRRLRDGGNDVAVIIVTAHGSIPDAVEAMKLGAIDFLPKPLYPDAIRAKVAEVLERESAAAGPREDHPHSLANVITAETQFAANLARAKRALNRREFVEADVYLKQAIALTPSSAEAHNLLGVLYELRSDHAGSYREYKAALRADRGYLPAKHNMQRYYERFTFGKSNIPVDTG